MRTRKMYPLCALVCACVLVMAVGCGGEYPEDESESFAMMNTGAGFEKGGKCKVTEGDSKGKTGTYDGDGWCCVDNGMTCVECKKPSGGSRCEDVANQLVGGVKTFAPMKMFAK